MGATFKDYLALPPALCLKVVLQKPSGGSYNQDSRIWREWSVAHPWRSVILGMPLNLPLLLWAFHSSVLHLIGIKQHHLCFFFPLTLLRYLNMIIRSPRWTMLDSFNNVLDVTDLSVCTSQVIPARTHFVHTYPVLFQGWSGRTETGESRSFSFFSSSFSFFLPFPSLPLFSHWFCATFIHSFNKYSIYWWLVLTFL